MKPPRTLTDPAAVALLRRMTSVPWRLLLSGPASGPENMAVDESLLSAASVDGTPPTLRFYRWDPPAVSLGRFQGEAGVSLEYARNRGWDVVRRATGGRGVLHQHELTYSVTLPGGIVAGTGVRASYCVLTAALNSGLDHLLGAGSARAPANAPAPSSRGVANCFALTSECDTAAPGGKLVGSAQVRRGGALLQHGSILLDIESDAWESLFGETGCPITLRQLLGECPTPDTVASAVVRGFEDLGVRWAKEIQP
jgi:lipoate-protein ligase A